MGGGVKTHAGGNADDAGEDLTVHGIPLTIASRLLASLDRSSFPTNRNQSAILIGNIKSNKLCLVGLFKTRIDTDHSIFSMNIGQSNTISNGRHHPPDFINLTTHGKYLSHHIKYITHHPRPLGRQACNIQVIDVSDRDGERRGEAVQEVQCGEMTGVGR